MIDTKVATALVSVGAHALAVGLLPTEAPPVPEREPVAFTVVDAPPEEELPEEDLPEEDLPEEDPAVEEEPTEPETQPEELEAPTPPTPQPLPHQPRPPRGASPVAAEAAQVVAAESDEAPAMADFTMVQGEATRYAGGVTSRRGKAKRPVKRVGRPDGAGTGPAPAAPAVDRSRPARPASQAWSCSHLFPADAEVHHALVTVVVQVTAGGAVRRVDVVSDPGQGFGAAARACAFGQSYRPALDRAGQPVAGATAPFTVRFVR